MANKPELVKKMQEYFNLNIYETKVWLALLGKGSATAGEVAEISNVPRSRTYDVLESLEKQGFAILKIGKPIKYIAVNPAIVLERIKGNVVREAEEKEKFLQKIKDHEDYRQLVLLHKQGISPIQPEEISSLIKGRSNLHNHLKSLLLKSEKSAAISSTASALLKKKWMKSVITNLQKNKINVRIMASGSEEEIASLSKELGVSIKHSNIDSRFCLIDDKEMIFMLTPDSIDEEYDYGVWLDSSFFVKSISALFDMAWRN